MNRFDDILHALLLVIATGLISYAVLDANDAYPLLGSTGVVESVSDRGDTAQRGDERSARLTLYVRR